MKIVYILTTYFNDKDIDDMILFHTLDDAKEAATQIGQSYSIAECVYEYISDLSESKEDRIISSDTVYSIVVDDDSWYKYDEFYNTLAEAKEVIRNNKDLINNTNVRIEKRRETFIIEG